MLIRNKNGRPKNNFIVWDIRNDYVGIVKVLPHTKAIPLTRAKWNVIKPTTMPDDKYKQQNVNRWFDAVAGKIGDFLELGIAGRNFLSRHLKELYATEFQKANRWPAIKDLVLYFDNLDCENRDEKGYCSRVLEKLRAFDSACEYMLDCEVGFNFEKLLNEGWNLVIIVADLNKIFCDLVTTLMMEFIYYARLWNDEKPRTRLFMVLDERRHLLQKRPSGMFDITDFNLLLVRCRKFDMVFIFIEQVPSQISDVVSSLAQIKLAFNTQAMEVWSTAKLIGLTREQAEVLRELPRGQCIVTLGGPRWPHPMLLDTPKFHTDIINLPQMQINKLCEQSTADLESDVKPRYLVYEESITASKSAEKDPDALTRNECLVLGVLALGPKTIEQTRMKTGLDVPQETVARTGLMKKGHLRYAGSFGNKRKVHCLTDKGAAKAKGLLGRSVYRHKGGPIHYVILVETRMSLCIAIPGSKFEEKNITFNGVQVDGLLFFPGKYGTRAAIQIVASTSNYPREAININKLAAVSDLDFVIVVSVSRTIQLGMEKALRKEFNGEIPGKIRSVNAEQILQPDWDWIAQFEGEY